ncbi:MAG: Sec-independent protein translocase protein TatB [Campylobacterota bacterium]|nr:Sec-independent protein translocase protein TatB [Campylobacterota bacterium]
MFGMGFTEILIIAVIAILFLGPDKLPSAMVEVAKFFRNVKKTVGTVKDSLEQEMHVADIKEEALAYKKELLSASNDLKKATDISSVGASLTNLSDDFLDDDSLEPVEKKESPKAEKITFEKKNKTKKIDKEETTDV